MQSDGGRRSRSARGTPRLPREANQQRGGIHPGRRRAGRAALPCLSIVLAGVLTSLATPLASAAYAQTAEPMQVLRDTSQLCSPQRILQEVGPADRRAEPVAAPINVLAIEYEIS